jgi:hypothetical protein
VDVESCYFIETNLANRPAFSSVYDPITNLNARKIVQYTYIPGTTDSGDSVGGHGTHTAGTLAGNVLGADIEGTGEYNGKISLLSALLSSHSHPSDLHEPPA